MSAAPRHLLSRSGPAAAFQAYWSAWLRPGAGVAACATSHLLSRAGCAAAPCSLPNRLGLLMSTTVTCQQNYQEAKRHPAAEKFLLSTGKHTGRCKRTFTCYDLGKDGEQYVQVVGGQARA